MKQRAGEPVLSPIEKVAVHLRDELGVRAQIADLGSSSAGINLNMTNEARSKLLDELIPAIKSLGFTGES